MRAVVGAVLALAAVATAEVYLKETFDAGWEDRWTVGSEWKSSAEMGEWKWTSGKWYADEDNKGIQTGQDARFYSISADLDAEVSNKGKDLIVSYTVKHEQKLDCGGAYIKLLPAGINKKKFGGDDEYAIMFGPDICGTGTRKTHAIFTYKGENLLTKKNIRCETDQLSHQYTFIVRPDNTYEVQIDGSKVESGSLFDDWDFLPPKTIKDPNESKPADWVDDAKMPDPEDSKPAGWDDIPEKIPDPEAEMPDDWDEDEDGEWEPVMIDNPEYKGEWAPKMIDNPDYKGPWVHPEIDNPDYFEDDEVYAVCDPCAAVGFELWQVKAGTIFDNIIVSDSLEEVEAFIADTFDADKDAEKAMFDKIEADKKAEQEKAAAEAEAARKAAEEAEADDDEDDEDDDEDDDGHDGEL